MKDIGSPLPVPVALRRQNQSDTASSPTVLSSSSIFQPPESKTTPEYTRRMRLHFGKILSGLKNPRHRVSSTESAETIPDLENSLTPKVECQKDSQAEPQVATEYAPQVLSSIIDEPQRKTSRGKKIPRRKGPASISLPSRQPFPLPASQYQEQPRTQDKTRPRSSSNVIDTLVKDQVATDPRVLPPDRRFCSFDPSTPYRKYPSPALPAATGTDDTPATSSEQDLGLFQVKRRTSLDVGILPYGIKQLEAMRFVRAIKDRAGLKLKVGASDSKLKGILKNCREPMFNDGRPLHEMKMPLEEYEGPVWRRNHQGMGPMSRYIEGPRRKWNADILGRPNEWKRNLEVMDAEILFGLGEERFEGGRQTLKAFVTRGMREMAETEWHVRGVEGLVGEGAIDQPLDEYDLDDFFAGEEFDDLGNGNASEEGLMDMPMEEIGEEIDEMVLL